jgi:hypothetical protein
VNGRLYNYRSHEETSTQLPSDENCYLQLYTNDEAERICVIQVAELMR